jgi:hypothetical protein
MVVDSRHPAPPVTTSDASAAFVQVLHVAGASRGLSCDGASFERRDPVDERIVEDVVHGTGSFIDDPSQVGGWPELAAGVACADADHDGMPDAFERLYGFDPADPDDAALDRDGDGYTNLEDFLNAVAVPEPRPGLLQAGALVTVAAIAAIARRRRRLSGTWDS